MRFKVDYLVINNDNLHIESIYLGANGAKEARQKAYLYSNNRKVIRLANV